MNTPVYYFNTEKLLRDALRTVKSGIADEEDIERWLKIIGEALKTLYCLIQDSTLAQGREKSFQAIIAQIHSFRDSFMHYSKTGAGLKGDQDGTGVKWGKITSAFKRCIVTRVITNLEHLNIKDFMNEAKSVFFQKVTEVFQTYPTVKVNWVPYVEFSKIKDE